MVSASVNSQWFGQDDCCERIGEESQRSDLRHVRRQGQGGKIIAGDE